MLIKINDRNKCCMEFERHCNRHPGTVYKRYEIACSCEGSESHKTYACFILEPFEIDDPSSICGCACECNGCYQCRCPRCIDEINYESCVCKKDRDNESGDEEEEEEEN